MNRLNALTAATSLSDSACVEKFDQQPDQRHLLELPFLHDANDQRSGSMPAL